jgi:flagellar basal body-associated protein FliL
METAVPAPTSSRLLKTLIVILLVILLAWPVTFGIVWGLNQA